MGKDRTRKNGKGSTSNEHLLKVNVGDVLVNVQDELRDIVIRGGMDVVLAMLEKERAQLCGERRRRQPDRTAYRYGHDAGRLVLGGRKVVVQKPRVRTLAGQEVELPSWRRYRDEDPLRERMVEQVLRGVSTRKYKGSLEAIPAGMRETTVKRSSVSRRFVTETAARVEKLLTRPLDDVDIPALMIDGTGIGSHLVVVALGFDVKGRKHVLGVAAGTTENQDVCERLLGSLIERGLPIDRPRLVVIDGGKGLRKAVRRVFGASALVQRCQVHKLRNVVERLPEGKQQWARTSLRTAWAAANAGDARRQLKRIAALLMVDHPTAARSVLEGLDETLTLLSLGIRGALMRTFRTTNAIENLMGLVKERVRRVKRWRNERMALRWTATSLLESEKSFRRVRGCDDLHRLLAALDVAVRGKTVDSVVAA